MSENDAISITCEYCVKAVRQAGLSAGPLVSRKTYHFQWRTFHSLGKLTANDIVTRVNDNRKETSLDEIFRASDSEGTRFLQKCNSGAVVVVFEALPLVGGGAGGS